LPKDRRVRLSTVLAALAAADLPEEHGARFLRELRKRLPRLGRKPETDTPLGAEALKLYARGHLSLRAACKQVTRNHPESTFNRVYKKTLVARRRLLRNQGQVQVTRTEPPPSLMR
jgi:hypothetical protein